jgi:hypothetical protein
LQLPAVEVCSTRFGHRNSPNGNHPREAADTRAATAQESTIKITILPPGKAIGADDLQQWSRQRNAGRSGVPDDRLLEKRLRRQKKRRTRWLHKHQREYPSKGLADVALEEHAAVRREAEGE